MNRTRKLKVSVIVPAYNEEGNIKRLLSEFADTFTASDFNGEVVMVDDGSTDDTYKQILSARRLYRFVKIVKNPTRMGLTGALKRGFAAASGDILTFYPADLQFRPADLPRLVDGIKNGADMVCGRKVGQYSKWFVSFIYNILTKLLFPKLKVKDMNSIKAFTRRVYQDFPRMREGWHRYLAAFAVSKGYTVTEVPVKLYKRHSGKSKFSGKKRILKGLTDLIAVKFHASVLGDPMHIFGSISLFFFIIGLLVAAVAFYLRFVEHAGYRPILYVVILCGVSSLITFVMGIITESLVYLRDSIDELKDENKLLTKQISRFSQQRNHNNNSTSTVADKTNNNQKPSRPRNRRNNRKPSNKSKSPQQEIKLRDLPANQQKSNDEAKS